MAGTLTTLAEEVIAQCEAGIYALHEGSEPIDLLARGIVETYNGNLETAKDLLSEAHRRLDGKWGVRAGVQLAVAYYRGGERDEAAALLETLPESFEGLMNRAVIETETDPVAALKILVQAESYDVSRYMWGRLHNQRGICYRKLGLYGQAKAEYKAALYFLRDCPLEAIVKNNLGAALENTAEAHASIDSAIETLTGTSLGQAYDLKARTFLKEDKPERAEEYASFAVDLLEKTDNRAWLSESLLTYADALIASEKHQLALVQLVRVWEIGEYLGSHDLKFKSAQLICATSKQLQKVYHIRSVQIALETSTSLNAAARQLGISRQAMQDFMEVHGLKFTNHKSELKISQS